MRDFPGYLFFGSFCEEARAGGCMICLAPEFAEQFHTIDCAEILAGRCLIITCSGPEGVLQVCCLHLVPSLSRPAKRALLRQIRDRFLSPAQGLGILAGDFNFYATGEARQYGDGTHHNNSRTLAEHFDNLFTDFGEVEQNLHTHKEEVGGNVVSMARLDRIYVNCFPAVLKDLQPMTGVIGYGESDWCSDHAPVFLGLGVRRAPRYDQVPAWLAKTAEFKDAVEEVMSEIVLEGTIGEKLSQYKHVLYEAGMRARRKREEGGARTIHDKVSWMYAVLNAVRTNKLAVLRRAVRAYPALREYVNEEEGVWHNLEGFHQHLQRLTLQTLAAEEEEVLRSSLPQATKDARVKRINRLQQAWARVRRVAPFVGIYDGQRREMTDPAECSRHLADHWGE
eukprot:7855637-Pyramimonas_sp.AAC.1